MTFFAKAFTAMVDALVEEFGFDREVLLDEFRAVHQRFGDSEQPFALLELPSVQARFGNLGRLELKRRLEGPLHAFNAERKRSLKLYDSVAETLATLREQGFLVVGHTEAMKANAYYRLDRLRIADLFQRLYVLESGYTGHPDPERAAELRPAESFVHVLPRTERKPNPAVLLDICAREGVSKERAYYVGDSLTRDIGMAKSAGVQAIWARYGTIYDRRLWNTLVRVTHWTDQDVRREAELRSQSERVQPDFIIDSFDELLEIVGAVRFKASARAV